MTKLTILHLNPFLLHRIHYATQSLNARIVEPQMSSARQSLGKHVPIATNMHTTIEKLLETVFSMQSMLKLYKEELPRVVSWEKYGSWVLWGPKTKNNCAGKASSNLPKNKTGLGQKDDHRSHRAWNQKWLCWWKPGANYKTRPGPVSQWLTQSFDFTSSFHFIPNNALFRSVCNFPFENNLLLYILT